MRPVTALLTALVALAPLPAAAQGSPATKPDAEVMNYRLSMKKLHKLIDVQRGMNKLNAKDPQLFDKIDREHSAMAKKNGAPLTVAQRASIFDRYPEIKRVCANAGGTTRDWILTGEAMGDAYTWIETKKGTLRGPPPTTDAQKANVALLEKNQAEFQKIMEDLDQLTNEMLE